MKKEVNNRKLEYNCDDIFPNRWSPRAMSGETVPDEELMKLFEAARWAPSTYNTQPWRFLYAKRDTDNWGMYFSLLVEKNQIWCKNAGALVVVVSKTMSDYNDKPVATHALNTGAAWQSLALQGSLSGFVVHGMAGFDYERAKQELDVPDDYSVQMMIAIGKSGKKEDLPEDLQKMETPSDRYPLNKIVIEGKFKEEK